MSTGKETAMPATTSIPDNLPRLIHGAGDTPEDGACAMQAVAWLSSAGKEWTDSPSCTHPVFRRLVVHINDAAADTTRQLLWPLLPRLIGTRDPDPGARNRVSVALAAWSAEQVHPLIKNQEQRKTAASRIARARAWLNSPQLDYAVYTAYTAYTADGGAYAAAAAASAAAAAAAAYAAYAAASAAAAAAAVAAAAAAAAAVDAAAADAASAAAVDAADTADAASAAGQIKFLTGLLDEYDRITGRTQTPPIPDTTWAQFRATIGTNRKTA
jgi:hypothetical protein